MRYTRPTIKRTALTLQLVCIEKMLVMMKYSTLGKGILQSSDNQNIAYMHVMLIGVATDITTMTSKIVQYYSR